VRGIRRFLMAGPSLAIALFVGAGMGSVFLADSFDFRKMGAFLLGDEALSILRLTVVHSGVALVISWAAAWGWLLIAGARGLGVLRFLSVLPGMAYALAVVLVLRGLRVENPYSMRSVVIAWVLAGIPYLASGMAEGIRDLGIRRREALKVLGARPWQVWWHHEFRGTAMVQVSLVLQQLWFYLTSFSLVLILGGGPPSETLEVGIYSSVRLGNPDFSKAMALVVLQAGLLLLVRGFARGVQSRIQSPRALGEGFGVQSDRLGRMAVGVLILGLLGASVGLGLDLGTGNGSASREMILGDFAGPVGMSLGLGAMVVLLTSVFAISSYLSGLKFLAGMGTWTSPVMISLSVWNLSGFLLPSWWNVALIQSVFFAPWFARSVFPLLDRTQKPELEAARALGAKPWVAYWQVEWPRIRGAVIRSLGLVFALSVTEVTSVMLFSRGNFDTLSSFSQNLFSRFRIEEAAFGVLLMLLMASAALACGEEKA